MGSLYLSEFHLNKFDYGKKVKQYDWIGIQGALNRNNFYNNIKFMENVLFNNEHSINIYTILTGKKDR